LGFVAAMNVYCSDLLSGDSTCLKGEVVDRSSTLDLLLC
jgi:hypothetical protein